MAMEITQFLVAVLSADAGVRTGAKGSLRQLQEQHLPQFLLSLSFELANDEKPLESRRLAGTLLFNSLDADNMVQQWIAIEDTVIKSQIKDKLLATLGSSSLEARRSSSKVIAKVASIDIPLKQWSQLFNSLLSNMTEKASPATLKQSTLETLGYVCEEISHGDLVQDEVNSVLLAIVYGTVEFETNTQVHLAAMKALLHALDIAQVTFDDEMHRTYIMKMVLKTAMSHEAEIRHAACECLVSIASIYHEVMDPYISDMFRYTSDAINGYEESVALQAVDLWNSICSVEIEQNLDPHSYIIKRVLPHLVPLLLEALLKQDQGHDVWNLSMAAGTCLDLVKTTVGADIVPFVRTFVEAKISEPYWSTQEATTHALGSVLERFC